MSQGTKFTVKASLLNAIKALVKTNKIFATSSDKIQTAANHIVESLWDKDSYNGVLTITEDNKDDYIVTPNIDGLQYTIINNVPDNIGYIDMQVLSSVTIFAIKFANPLTNGRKIVLIGNFSLGQLDDTVVYDGKFCAYLYNYVSGADVAAIISGNIALSPAYRVHAYLDFMNWNNIWYYRGY